MVFFKIHLQGVLGLGQKSIIKKLTVNKTEHCTDLWPFWTSYQLVIIHKVMFSTVWNLQRLVSCLVQRQNQEPEVSAFKRNNITSEGMKWNPFCWRWFYKDKIKIICHHCNCTSTMFGLTDLRSRLFTLILWTNPSSCEAASVSICGVVFTAHL